MHYAYVAYITLHETILSRLSIWSLTKLLSPRSHLSEN